MMRSTSANSGGHYSELRTDSATVAVNPTDTVLATFEVANSSGNSYRRPDVCGARVVNNSGTETVDVYVETRLKAGSGAWQRSVFAGLTQIGPSTVRDDIFEMRGFDEVRLVGVSTGAGASVDVSVRLAWGSA